MTNQTHAHRSWTTLVVLASVLASVAGVACEGSPRTGITDPAADVAAVRVTLARAGASTAAQAVAGWFASSAGLVGRIDLTTVDSLPVTLDRIEFLPAVQDEGDGENGQDTLSWMALDVEDIRIDLLALPMADEDGVVLVTGDLPVGDYARVRLFVTDPMLWLNAPLQVGGAYTYDAGVGHPVTIPSGTQTGIKTDQGFSVADGGGDVLLVFDENATLANVHGTGNGKVMLAPVLRVRTP